MFGGVGGHIVIVGEHTQPKKSSQTIYVLYKVPEIATYGLLLL